MTEKEFVLLQQVFPDAERVWRDRMFELKTDQLLDEMVNNMDTKLFHGVLLNIQKEVEESRTEEGETND
tara:strand:+ start:3740 stop:3946 length:207 start_codon:yes stop_codon:yes gene_type:complete